MVPAQGTHHCQRYDRVFVAGTMYEPDEISRLKLVIEAKDAEIAELKAQIEKLKTCKNCKWQGSKFATCVQGCNWELEE
jgi:hypothetical protein